MRQMAYLGVLASMACTGQVVQANGDAVYRAFEFEKAREWTFMADGIDYRLQARQSAQAVGSTDSGAAAVGVNDAVFEIEFFYDCISDQSDCATKGREGTKAFSWKLSSNLANGVLFHADGETTFDPPVQLSDGTELRGTAVTTESGGVTYTSTYLAFETCPAPRYWPDPANSGTCYKIEVTDGDAGTPIAGTYWATLGFGIVAFTEGADTTWSISDFRTPEDD